LWNRQIFQQLF